MYTIQERVRIVILMAKYESVTAVERQITKEGFQHKLTDQTIRLLYKKFLETSSVEDKVRSGRPNSSVNPENAQKVVAILEDKENFYSVPAISNMLDISIGSTFTILHTMLNYKPYKLQLHQKLSEEDFMDRMNSCQAILDEHVKSNNLFDNLITSDECSFSLNGTVNRYNCRVWAAEPPETLLLKEHTSPKINVWMAISASHVYGPYFFNSSTVNGDDYYSLISEYFIPMLRRQRRLQSAWFQQDGAPSFIIIENIFLM